MVDKALRKMSRSDLLELLISQMKENEKLRVQLKETEEQLKFANEQLMDKKICIFNAGSMAEASLMLNGVFEAADAACKQYVESIKELNERQLALCDQLEQEYREASAQSDLEKT